MVIMATIMAMNIIMMIYEYYYDDYNYPDEYYYEYPNDYYTNDLYRGYYNDYRNTIISINWDKKNA